LIQLFYRFARGLCALFLKLVYRLRVFGRENIPACGPFIICANHINWFDPLAVGSALPARLKVHFMAKKEIFRNRFAGYVLRKVGAFPVNRQSADYAAIRRSLQILSEGNVIGLFPEGTRSKTGQLQEPHHGSALLVGRSEAPVLPVAVIGPYRIGRPLRIHIGPSFVLPRLEYALRHEKKRKLEQMSKIIMDNIKKLFPPGDNNDPE
jgi:1-acyl-sn-glycerol-3-phosphate acyltransferase